MTTPLRGALALLLLIGCATTPAHRPTGVVTLHATDGIASWYGPGFTGKKTANGEIYDPRDMTAAHKTLPFDTRVLVTSRDSGHAVWVRINDRGPYVDGRIIDLSYAAAQALDMVGAGTAPVTLRLAPSSGTRTPAQIRWFVQIGAFRDREQAETLAEKVSTRAREAHVHEGELYLVRVGPYPTRDRAEQEADALGRRGYRSFLVSQ